MAPGSSVPSSGSGSAVGVTSESKGSRCAIDGRGPGYHAAVMQLTGRLEAATHLGCMTRPQAAGLLSFIVPGIGQIYNGDILRGLFWLVVTPGFWIGSG